MAAIGIVAAGESNEFIATAGISELPTAAYYLFYQDIGGGWHRTKLVPWARRFRAQFLGTVKARKVPKAVLEEAQVVSAWEVLESGRP